jgi:carboxyl-terminal processing protease
VVQKGLVSQFCFEYTDNNRAKYANIKNADEVLKQLKREHVIQQFINYCDSKGVKRRNNMILHSQQLIENVVHGLILYNLLDITEYIKFINKEDVTIKKAIQLFNDNLTTPTLPTDDKTTDKKTAYAAPHPTIRVWLSA